MKKLMQALLAIIVVLVLAATLLLFVARDMVTSPFDNVHGLEKGKTTIDSTTVGGSLHDLSQLTTQEYVFTNVGKFDDEGYKLLNHNIPLTGKNFLATYDGTVKAGIDFGQVSVEEYADKKEFEVTAPRPTITDAYIDPASIKAYDQSMNPFNQFEMKDAGKFLEVETAKAKDVAVERGVLESAQKQAETIIVNQVAAVTKGSEKQDYAVKVSWR